jgi:hypothetical protein
MKQNSWSEEQRHKFIEMHGREPGPNDPLPDPEPLEHLMVEKMKEAGMDPALNSAYEKTGRLQPLLSEARLAERDAGIDKHERKHRKNKPPKYPMGTVALYGPDDKTTTKFAAAVFPRDGSRSILNRWVGSDVTTNPKVQRQMMEFFEQHGVQSVATADRNMGCPHEEGEDFPVGGDCLFCPWWKGKQGSNRKE